MAMTLSQTRYEDFDGFAGFGFYLGTATFDSVYATGGESITPADLGMSAIELFIAEGDDGLTFEYDYVNQKLKAIGGSPASPGIVDDSDTAATLGADLQIAVSDHVANAVEENALVGLIGRFEAINAGNATVHDNQVGTAASAANPTFSVWDNDNAETETAAMADVYVAPAGGGFYAVTLSGLDTYVPLSNGEFIKVQYDADPASNQSAVQVYYDDDATNAHERLLAVVADNLDETFVTASELSLKPSGAEVSPGTDLSAAVARIWALGTI
jgi:hypothetical protein